MWFSYLTGIAKRLLALSGNSICSERGSFGFMCVPFSFEILTSYIVSPHTLLADPLDPLLTITICPTCKF